MVIDDELMHQVTEKAARLDEAERHADRAKADYHQAVRRLHLAGGSLREIAEALGLSHQRVHQIIEASGGTIRWKPKKAGSAEPACTFCGRLEHDVRQLIAGPGAYICSACVRLARRVVRRGEQVDTALTSLQPVPATSKLACSFCAKPARQVTRLVAGPGIRICNECLDRCDEILAARPVRR